MKVRRATTAVTNGKSGVEGVGISSNAEADNVVGDKNKVWWYNCQMGKERTRKKEKHLKDYDC